MGNTHACCSVDSSNGTAKESVIKTSQHHQHDGVKTSERTETTSQPSDADIESFRARIENSIGIMVVIADGKKIHCRLRWQPAENNLVMTCEANNHLHIRRMGLEELVTVISGKRELGRVATKAKIVDDPTCVALHLASNTCIPICLDSEDDKDCFVALIHRLKKRFSSTIATARDDILPEAN